MGLEGQNDTLSDNFNNNNNNHYGHRNSIEKQKRPEFDIGGNSSNISNNNGNGISNESFTPDSSLPVTIDLTGPLPVISVLKRDATGLVNYNYAPEKLYHKLIREAPLVPVKTPKSDIEDDEQDSSFNDTDNNSDINQELLTEGRRFIKRNFFAIIFAHLVSVAFLLAIKPIQALLLRTGSIHNKENTLKRYLSLILSVKNLYECDFLAEGNNNDKFSSSQGQQNSATNNNTCNISKASKELKKLRKLEGKIAKKFRIYASPPLHQMKLDKDEQELLNELKKDLHLLDEIPASESEIKNLEKIYTTVNPDIPMSQYDLAIVQFAFFGFISLFPRVFGIHETEKKYPDGVKGFIHIWSIIGKRLGLEDRFNMCLEHNFDQATNMRIFREIFLFSFKIADETLIKLWKSMTCGSFRYFYFFRTKAMIQFMLKNVAGISNCRNVFSIMNLCERICYYNYVFCVKWLLRFWFTRVLMNLSSKAVFYLGYKFYLRRLKQETYDYDRDLVVKTVS